MGTPSSCEPPVGCSTTFAPQRPLIVRPSVCRSVSSFHYRLLNRPWLSWSPFEEDDEEYPTRGVSRSSFAAGYLRYLLFVCPEVTTLPAFSGHSENSKRLIIIPSTV